MTYIAERSQFEMGVLRLTLYDVRRNQARELSLRFIEVRGHPHVLYPATAPPEWVSVVRDSAVVRWTIGHHRFIGSASPVDDPTTLRDDILPRYLETFGPDRISRWFGPEIGCVRLLESSDGFPYYRAVEALFDSSAPKYDRVVQGNPFDLHLRRVALGSLRALYHTGQKVLELGCGTGLETIPLAEAGVNVVALDISSEMLNQLGRKARLAGVQDRIDARQVALGELSNIVSDLGPGSFDGAFSHFGALNCEPHLARVPGALHQLLRPGARVSLGVWNRTCLWEMIGYGAALSPRRALARFQSSVPVGKSRFGVPVFPYSPRETARLFSPFFVPEGATGVSVLMPPYNLANRLLSHPRLIALLEAADRGVRDRPFLRFLGDHFLLTMRRR
jgi:SAM-dependent methyltransferase